MELIAAQIALMGEVPDESKLLSLLRGVHGVSPSLRSLSFGTVDNRFFTTGGFVPPPGWDLRLRPWYIEATAERGLVFTDPFLHAGDDAMVVTAAQAVYSHEGTLLGVVVADIALGTIAGFLADTPITEGSVSLLYNGGNLITSASDTLDNSVLAKVARHLPFVGTGQAYVGTGVLRDRVIYVPVPSVGWRLVAYIPWEDVFPHTRHLWLYVGLIGLSVTGLMVGLATFYYGQVSAPLLALEQTINSLHIREDCFDRIRSAARPARFAELVNSINDLLDRAQSYYLEVHTAKVEMEAMNARLEVAVTEECEAREELEIRQGYWRALFENAKDAITVVDASCTITAVNEAFLRLFEWESEGVLSKNIDLLVASHRLDEAQSLSQQLAVGIADFSTTRLTRFGQEVEVEISIVPIRALGQEEGAYAIYRDVRARRAAEREMQRLSQYDQLTGVYNRTFFDTTLRELEQSSAYPVSVLLGDTNGLKLINDAFGHALGDEILRLSADALRACARPGDILARVGGDEFAMILPNTTEGEAEALVSCIEVECRARSEGLRQLSIAFGVSCKSSAADNLLQLFVLAEDRMYRRKLREGKSVRGALITSLMQALEEKTRDTTAHSDRMGKLARDVARRLGVTGSDLEDIDLLATLHDIGKIGVPDSILNKPSQLSPDEWEVMKKHSEIGYRIASATVELAHLAEGILHHHERWDGTGYPYALAGEDIPWPARIIAVVDAYDAMTNIRSYRSALTHSEALQCIHAGSGQQFSPAVAEVFLAMMAEFN
ncbi:MAG: Cyclic di-GMP phosphodiesterase response regulator RpfG [Firmicutes bacterium]|nr:Cyclic di-GMP phosphodiesterase response regulator RpfG [candidate division NPL-UPA2 bacterium]